MAPIVLDRSRPLPTGVVLRPAQLEDAPVLGKLEQRLFPGEAWTVAQLAQEIVHPSRRYVVAERSAPADAPAAPPTRTADGRSLPVRTAGDAAPNAIVGYAGIMIAGDSADIHTIGTVEPGAGIGRALLAWCADAALRGGAEQMFLEVRIDNERARVFYERAGFEELAVRRGYYRIDGRSIDGLTMRAALRDPE